MSDLNESTFLSKILAQFPRSPLQLNRFNTSDAEIIEFCENNFMAISLDIFGDTLDKNLFTDPESEGQHIIESALSDLAAVGASPKGVIHSLVIPSKNNDALNFWLLGFQKGLNAHSTFLWGGDTASGPNLSWHVTVVGQCLKLPRNRLGMKPGDTIYSTNKAGRGNALVAKRWLEKNVSSISEHDHIAQARIQEGLILNGWASCAIDSSDGFLNALSTLIELNKCGIKLIRPLSDYLDPIAIKYADVSSLPAWCFLAGDFGDYELVFCVSKHSITEFESTIAPQLANLVKVGEVINQPTLLIPDQDLKYKPYDANKIRNWLTNSNISKLEYLDLFINESKNWPDQ